MLSQYISAIEGISAYPIFSLFIFIPFFVGVTVWVFRLDKQFISHMMNLPLDETSESGEERKKTV